MCLWKTRPPPQPVPGKRPQGAERGVSEHVLVPSEHMEFAFTTCSVHLRSFDFFTVFRYVNPIQELRPSSPTSCLLCWPTRPARVGGGTTNSPGVTRVGVQNVVSMCQATSWRPRLTASPLWDTSVTAM